jgi:hypothetical protein
LKCRLYPGQDDTLIAWALSLDDLPFGAKSQAIKEALLVALEEAPTPNSTADREIDAGALLDTLLPEIRRVVEAAVATALARTGYVATISDRADDDGCSETEALLADLGAELLLDDEDLE